jgi:hypothetical protein
MPLREVLRAALRPGHDRRNIAATGVCYRQAPGIC